MIYIESYLHLNVFIFNARPRDRSLPLKFAHARAAAPFRMAVFPSRSGTRSREFANVSDGRYGKKRPTKRREKEGKRDALALMLGAPRKIGAWQILPTPGSTWWSLRFNFSGLAASLSFIRPPPPPLRFVSFLFSSSHPSALRLPRALSLHLRRQPHRRV